MSYPFLHLQTRTSVLTSQPYMPLAPDLIALLHAGDRGNFLLSLSGTLYFLLHELLRPPQPHPSSLAFNLSCDQRLLPTTYTHIYNTWSAHNPSVHAQLASLVTLPPGPPALIQRIQRAIAHARHLFSSGHPRHIVRAAFLYEMNQPDWPADDSRIKQLEPLTRDLVEDIRYMWIYAVPFQHEISRSKVPSTGLLGARQDIPRYPQDWVEKAPEMVLARNRVLYARMCGEMGGMPCASDEAVEESPYVTEKWGKSERGKGYVNMAAIAPNLGFGSMREESFSFDEEAKVGEMVDVAPDDKFGSMSAVGPSFEEAMEVGEVVTDMDRFGGGAERYEWMATNAQRETGQTLEFSMMDSAERVEWEASHGNVW